MALGFKFSYSNLERYPSIVSWLQDHNIKIVHWYRYNLVKRYVSHLTKNVRRLAHSTQPVNRITVYVDPRKIKKNLETQSFLRDKYRAIFRDKDYIEMLYESFVNNQGAEARRILHFLQVDDSVSLWSPLVKQNPDNLREIIKNYDEVVQVLKGTSFEKFLIKDH